MKRFLSTLLLAAAFSSSAFAADAKVDAGHSAILFKIQHFGAGYVWGRFTDFEGTVAMDGNELTSVNITAKVASIDTEIEQRDSHLRGPDFFNAAEMPTMTFTSTRVKKKGNGVFAVTGDLTLHSVTKSYTVEMKRTGEGDLPAAMGGAHLTGWETAFEIDRTKHNINYDGVGSTVYVHVNLEVQS